MCDNSYWCKDLLRLIRASPQPGDDDRWFAYYKEAKSRGDCFEAIERAFGKERLDRANRTACQQAHVEADMAHWFRVQTFQPAATGIQNFLKQHLPAAEYEVVFRYGQLFFDRVITFDEWKQHVSQLVGSLASADATWLRDVLHSMFRAVPDDHATTERRNMRRLCQRLDNERKRRRQEGTLERRPERGPERGPEGALERGPERARADEAALLLAMQPSKVTRLQ